MKLLEMQLKPPAKLFQISKQLLPLSGYLFWKK